MTIASTQVLCLFIITIFLFRKEFNMEKFIARPTKIESETYAAYEIIGSYFKKCIFKNTFYENKCAINFKLESDKSQYRLEDKFINFCEKRNFEEKFKDETCELFLDKKDDYYELSFLNKKESFKIIIFKDLSFKYIKKQTA